MAEIENIFVYVLLSEINKQYLRKRLSPYGVRLLFRDEVSDHDIARAILSSEVVFGNPPAKSLMGIKSNLQWIQLESTGFDAYQHIPIRASLTNLHGYFAEPCAETVIAGILALYRRINELVLLKQNKTWVGSDIRPAMELLRKKTVICLGSGTIARAIGKILDAFQCNITYYGHNHPEVTIHDRTTLLNVLPNTDILIDTLPGTVETAGFVDEAIFNAMKDQAVFVNIGRGSTVNEEALVKALHQQSIGGAVLDVYGTEPLAVDHPFWDCPNTILTQHTGGGSIGEERGKVDFFVDNFHRFIQGNPLYNVVTLKKGY